MSVATAWSHFLAEDLFIVRPVRILCLTYPAVISTWEGLRELVCIPGDKFKTPADLSR